MARHNEVTLYGMVYTEPRLLFNKPEGEPYRKLLRTMFPVLCIRGIREFGAKDKRIKADTPLVASGKKETMDLIKTLHKGDIVLIRGSYVTQDGKKAYECQNENCCGKEDDPNVKRYIVDTTSAFINPIYIKVMKTGLNDTEGMKEIRENAEISNRVTMIGKVCTPPEKHTTDKGQRIVNYQLEVQRKYRIKEDDDKNRVDFPFVKSYGEIADNDYIAIKKDGYVFVDGMIQTRQYTRRRKCPYCGEESTYMDFATEIVPYSTEYLTGCMSMDEVGQIKKEQADQEVEEIRKNI